MPVSRQNYERIHFTMPATNIVVYDYSRSRHRRSDLCFTMLDTSYLVDGQVYGGIQGKMVKYPGTERVNKLLNKI